MNMRLVIVVKSWFRVLEKNSCVQSPAQEEMGEQDHGYVCNIFLSFLMIDGWIGGGWCRGGLYFMHTTNLDNFLNCFLGFVFPRFNATDMLERIRNQRMVFVGDSLGRNHWESTMCMLAEAVTNKSRIYEINGEPISKHTGFLSFRFEDYNCTVEYYRSPFLVPQTRPPPRSPSTVACALRVDTIWSSSTTNWRDADILVFNAGHWWTKHKIFDQ
jgi:hypothetical protein